jgi:hypothetical protein
MKHRRVEGDAASQLRATVRLHQQIARTFAAMSGIGILAALAGTAGSNIRWEGILFAAWAGCAAFSFLLTANAFAEDAPIRWFVRRWAFAVASMPPLLWWIVMHPAEAGPVFAVGLFVLFFGWRALRYFTF